MPPRKYASRTVSKQHMTQINGIMKQRKDAQRHLSELRASLKSDRGRDLSPVLWPTVTALTRHQFGIDIPGCCHRGSVSGTTDRLGL